jgi:WD40 repeat protein
MLHWAGSQKAGLSALTLHGQAPLLATGSRNQYIKLYDASALKNDGGSAREIATIRYFDGFLGARIGPVHGGALWRRRAAKFAYEGGRLSRQVNALAFHPRKVLLAVGSTDSTVSVYSS